MRVRCLLPHAGVLRRHGGDPKWEGPKLSWLLVHLLTLLSREREWLLTHYPGKQLMSPARKRTLGFYRHVKLAIIVHYPKMSLGVSIFREPLSIALKTCLLFKSTHCSEGLHCTGTQIISESLFPYTPLRKLEWNGDTRFHISDHMRKVNWQGIILQMQFFVTSFFSNCNGFFSAGCQTSVYSKLGRNSLVRNLKLFSTLISVDSCLHWTAFYSHLNICKQSYFCFPNSWSFVFELLFTYREINRS